MTTAVLPDRPDRRRARKRVFAQAGAVAGTGLGAGAIAVAAGAPLAAAAAALSGAAAAAAWLHRPGGVPILVYHSVSPDAAWLPWAANTSVRPETLRRHLAALRSGGWTIVSTDRLVASRRDGTALPRRCVVLHFDDAYLDNVLFAAPILREFGAPATFFASTDFIASGDALRTGAAQGGPEDWRGYMNAAELRALDADPLFDVEAHGTNHARVPVSDEAVDMLTARNWKRHAPLSWAAIEGDKSRWYEAETPPPPLREGQAVPRTDSALAGRWHRAGGTEDEAAFADRVDRMLVAAHGGLADILGRPPRIMAWPFDRCCAVSIKAARRAGFEAVTGGRGENRPGEDPGVLSRVHMQDSAFGGGPAWLEALAAHARVNGAAGRLSWHGLTALAARLRRRRFGAPGYGAP